MVGVCCVSFSLSIHRRAAQTLMLATGKGHTATAQLLVEAGADKEAKQKVRDGARDAFANRRMVRGGGGGGVEGDEEGD